MILAAHAGKYAAKKKREAERQRKISAAGREIGSLPPVADPVRRAKAEKSLRMFLETYFGDVFSIAWSKDHLRILKRLEAALRDGGLCALAMPRGSGKTSIAEAAALWAGLTGLRRFLLLVAANGSLAAELCKDLKTYLQTNEKLAADFPEVCYPIFKLDGINQRAAGQLYRGKRTYLKFTNRQITLPTIPGSPASGSVIACAGITSAMRGMAQVTAGGQRIRPDFVLLDDPQTEVSARSAKQTRQRLDILRNTILQMAGPTVQISAVCCCTVIEPDDLADQLLNPDLCPDWESERIPLLHAMPTQMDLWDEYARLRVVDLKQGLKTTPNATAFYRSNRRTMDEGGQPYWPGRKLKHQLSALQYAMDIYSANPRGFMAEHQQRPRREAAPDRPTAEQLALRILDLDPLVVPLSSELLTVGIDQQETALYYAVIAWTRPDLSGVVIDYGTWPEQRSPYYTLRTLRKTFKDVLPGLTPAAQVRAALTSLVTLLTAPGRYQRQDGLAMDVRRVLVDSGQGVFTDTIYDFCRTSPQRGILWPSKGIGIKADKTPISGWRIQPGNIRGEEWLLSRPDSNRAVRLFTFDTNHWKTRLDHALSCPIENPGAIALHGPHHHPTHQMYADHLLAESYQVTEGRGRTVRVYKQRPGTENHYLDSTLLALLGAAYETHAGSSGPRTRRQGCRTLAA